MAFWEAAFGGSSGGNYRLRVNVDVVTQEVNNNRTLIRYNAWIDKVAGSGFFNNDPTYGNTNINGYNPGRSLASYNFAAQSRYYLAQNEDYWIGHDANGNANPYFGANYNLNNGTAITTSATGGNFSLPTIPRYANITSWTLGTATEKSVPVAITLDRQADLIDYQLNGGAWLRAYTGTFTNLNFTISSLIQNTTYNIKLRVRAAASGLYTDSGIKSTTTRAVTITSLTSPSATDTTVELLATTSHVADQLQYRVQGSGTWISTVTADFTSKQITVTGLSSNVSYTFEARARHKDSQTYTAVVTTTATTQYPQPLQPDNLAPANGQGVGTLTPTLTWRYNATSADTQSAYQVLVRRESDAVLMWDSGKTTSGLTAATVPGSAGLVYNVNYQWQVRSWSGTDIQGAYSALANFKTSQAPVVTVTGPTAGAVVSTDSPTITWTYSDPESTAQSAYGIDIRNAASQVVYSANFTGTATSKVIPTGFIQNGQTYSVVVRATDASGVEGISASVSFSVLFVGPPTPTVSVELADDKLFAQVEVVPTKPANDAFEGDYIKVFKRVVGAETWNFIGQVGTPLDYLDRFENVSEWLTDTGTPTVSTVTSNREGSSSMQILTTATGVNRIKRAVSRSIDTTQKMRVWVYKALGAPLASITFKVGTDSSNFYSYAITGASLTPGVFTSVEFDVSAMTMTGTPSFNAVLSLQIEVDSTGPIAPEQLLVDGWRLTTGIANPYVTDYELANGKSYEYSALSVNVETNLEGAFAAASAPVEIVYGQFANTFLIPVYSQSQAITTFMDTSDAPSYTHRTATEYYAPVGSQYPVSYSLGKQRYRSGSYVVQFWDERFDSDGMGGVKAFESIKNEKPLMVRTYWGEIYYVSIDGDLKVDRLKDVGWSVAFSWTELRDSA